MIHQQARRLRRVGQAIALLVMLLTVHDLRAQQRAERFIGPGDSTITLSDRFILPSSITLLIDSSITLRLGPDFTFEQESSRITLSPDTRRLLFGGLDTATRHRLSVSYRSLPLDLKESYSLYEAAPPAAQDSGRRAIAPVQNESTNRDLISSFQRSGAITRGFQLGSGRDLSLTSGFNLQFTGELAEDVVVTGALTEETIPIQPEGNTQTLRELDRIFINLKASKYFEATFGDFYLDLNSGRGIARLFEQASTPSPLSLTREWQQLTKTSFTSLSRKVLGVEALASLPWGAFTAGAASNKGRFTSNSMQGQEFFQGPYRLTGVNGERAAPVLAGTERVYVDGILQTRGERNDYVIDYATGELTFQQRRLITSASRITIDFEYAEQAYSRTLVVGQAQSMIVPAAVYIGATLLREGDDPDATLSLSLSDQDRETLRLAGNDPSRANRSGVTFAGRTDAGRARGNYVKVDTTISGRSEIFYRYDPQDSLNALYSVVFGAVGSGLGSYTRRAISEFTFVGLGRGEYDTIVPLPLPQMTEVLGLNTVIRPFAGITLSGEVAGSRHTINRFAPLPDEGLAYRYSLGAQDSIPLFGSLHGFAATYRSELVRPDFHTIDRINSVEFDRSYGYDVNRSRVRATDYKLDEARVSISPFSRAILDASLSRYTTESSLFLSDRLATSLRVIEDTSFAPEINANFEKLKLTDDRSSDNSDWTRLSGRISRSLAFDGYGVTPYFAMAAEDRRSNSRSTDSLKPSSFRFLELDPGLKLQLGSKVSLSSDISLRSDDSGVAGVMQRVSNSQTLRFNANLNDLSGFSTLLSVTLREKEYTDSVSRARNGGDQSGILLRLEPRYSSIKGFVNADALYEISNQRTARIERLFFPVQRGYGNYKYLGDLNGNGRADVEEFSLARYSDEGEYVLITLPSEQLYPTTDLRTAARLRLMPAALLPVTDSTFFSTLMRGISSETSIRLEERSTLEDDASIFLLDLSKFRQDSTTLAGLLEFDQAVNLFEDNQTHSYRLRFYERTAAQQYTTGLERTYRAERSIRGRFRPAQELTNETMIRSLTDLALTRSQSFTQPYHVSGYGVETEWSYHPYETRFDYGLRGELLSTREQTMGTTALANAVTLKSSYSLESRTRLRGEIERDELTLKNAPQLATLPYPLTSGRVEGITWLWRLALDYNFGAGVIATLAYDGRNARTGFLTNERETIHNARAEVRAAF